MKWLSQSGWLKDSPMLEMSGTTQSYNLKCLLNDVTRNPFIQTISFG